MSTPYSQNKSPFTDRDNVRGWIKPVNMRSHTSVQAGA